MRVIIAGPRDLQLPTEVIGDMVEESGFEVTELLEGGAKGVDRSAREWAEEEGITYETVDAKWTELGKGAGPERNMRMANDHFAEALIAVTYGDRPVTSGTASMIAEAARAGLKIYVAWVYV